MDFAVPADSGVNLKENEKKSKYFDLDRELKNDYTNCNWFSWYSHQMVSIRSRMFRNKRTSGDNPNNGIAEISQNTEKNAGDLR